VRGWYGEIRGLGAEVVVVSFAPVERLQGYRSLHGWPFPVVTDPQRAAYRAFGLESAPWRRLLRPRVIWRYLALMVQGFRVRASDEDVHQLGGDFVLDRQRRIVFEHRSTDPADRPAVPELIAALRLAASAVSPGGGSS
jgi:hypothetical protein